MRLRLPRRAAALGPFACLAIFGCGMLGGSPASAGSDPVVTEPAAAAHASDLGESIQQRIHAIFEKARDAVVRIEATDNQGELSGTGFFIAPDGLLYTSYTVGGESQDIVVLRGDLKYPATRVIADAHAGVAILKVDARTPFLTLGSSRDLAIAAPVMTVGYPMDLPLTPSFGIVGGFDRKYLGRYFATTHIRANVPVQRGQGGAPLLNFNGEVVGILISSLDQGSALFALPIEAAEKVRRDYLRFGKLRPGWIGLDVDGAGTPTASSSALVRNVFPDTPGEKAGILPGDVIQQVGAVKVKIAEDVLDAAYFLTADDEVKVRVIRKGEMLDLRLVPADSPSSLRKAVPGFGTTSDLKGVPPDLDQLDIGH